MKLIVYTNLDKLSQSGVLDKLGLNKNRLSMHPIKGLSRDAAFDSLQDSGQLQTVDVILCCQTYAQPAQIISLLDLEQDYALALHNSSSSKLLDLYSCICEKTNTKILYRFESTEYGPTFDLLRTLMNRAGGISYRQALEAFFSEFEKDALTTYRRTLLESVSHPLRMPLLHNFHEVTRHTYLWQSLVKTKPSLPDLMEKFIAEPHPEAKRRLALLIEDQLFS